MFVIRNGFWFLVRLNYGFGLVLWYLGRDYLVSEMFVYEGVKYFFVRIFVIFINEIEYYFEVCLCLDFFVG